MFIPLPSVLVRVEHGESALLVISLVSSLQFAFEGAVFELAEFHGLKPYRFPGEGRWDLNPHRRVLRRASTLVTARIRRTPSGLSLMVSIVTITVLKDRPGIGRVYYAAADSDSWQRTVSDRLPCLLFLWNRRTDSSSSG